MRVELLIAPDCPNAQVARTVVLSCLSELGVAEPVNERVGRFRSPTVLVDGQDVMGASMDLGRVSKSPPAAGRAEAAADGTGQGPEYNPVRESWSGTVSDHLDHDWHRPGTSRHALVEGDACRLDLPTAERVLAAMRASLARGADGP